MSTYAGRSALGRAPATDAAVGTVTRMRRDAAFVGGLVERPSWPRDRARPPEIAKIEGGIAQTSLPRVEDLRVLEQAQSDSRGWLGIAAPHHHRFESRPPATQLPVNGDVGNSPRNSVPGTPARMLRVPPYRPPHSGPFILTREAI